MTTNHCPRGGQSHEWLRDLLSDPLLDFRLTGRSSYWAHLHGPTAVTKTPEDTMRTRSRCSRSSATIRPAALVLLSGFVLGCNSSSPGIGGPGDGPDLKPDFNALLGTYRVDLTQAYRMSIGGSLDTGAVGHYEGSVTLGQLTRVDTSDTDVSGDFAGSVQLTGTFHYGAGDAGACCTIFGSFSPATVRAQWRPEGRYDLRVVDDLPLGVGLVGVPPLATVTWTLLPGLHSYHDSSADRTIAVQREPDDTNLPYPNAAGIYSVTGIFDTLPNRTFTGTLKLQQGNRQSVVLTGSADIDGFFDEELDSAEVSTSGDVSFIMHSGPLNQRWRFAGTLSQNTITGRHLRTNSVTGYSGSWQGTR